MTTTEQIVLKHRKTITLKPCIEVLNLSQIKERFLVGYFDPLLEGGNLNEKQFPGESILIDISEMQPGQKAVVLQEIFNKEDMNMWIPQNRIVQTLKEYFQELIKNNLGNLFPVQTDNGVKYVLDIRINDQNKLDFRLYDNWKDIKYDGEKKHRVFKHAA